MIGAGTGGKLETMGRATAGLHIGLGHGLGRGFRCGSAGFHDDGSHYTCDAVVLL